MMPRAKSPRYGTKSISPENEGHQTADALAYLVQMLVRERLVHGQIVDPLAEMRGRSEFLPRSGRTGQGRHMHVRTEQPAAASGSQPNCRQVAKQPGLAILRAERIRSRFISAGRKRTDGRRWTTRPTSGNPDSDRSRAPNREAASPLETYARPRARRTAAARPRRYAARP